VTPDRQRLKQFLDSALIDPNKKGNLVESLLVSEGTPEYFEIRTKERLEQAKRLRARIATTKGTTRDALVDEYVDIIKETVSGLSIAACKLKEAYGPKTSETKNRPRSQNSGGNVHVPPGEAMGGEGDPR